MITRHEAGVGGNSGDLWARIAAPLPSNIVQWRQQGRPIQRDGRFSAAFVAYIDAQFVRERLDLVVPGEWDLTLELLPLTPGDDADEPVAFKARLQVLGVIREDVGTGRDYKNAATDAFKRAAVRFGVGHELYTDYSIIWVRVDGDGKYAKPLEDPADVWKRKQANPGTAEATSAAGRDSAVAPRSQAASRSHGGLASPAPSADSPAPIDERAPLDNAGDEASCPKCGGRMFDNRLTKRNPKAPDFKCRTRSCDGVIWPPKVTGGPKSPGDGFPVALLDDDADGLPPWENDSDEGYR